MLKENEIIKTISEMKEGIKYTTHYVNRPIRQGDSQVQSIGTTINGVDKTIEIIKWEYQLLNLSNNLN
jgi:archaellum component FlaC